MNAELTHRHYKYRFTNLADDAYVMNKEEVNEKVSIFQKILLSVGLMNHDRCTI